MVRTSLNGYCFWADLTLRTICTELGRVQYLWFQIGIQLGIPHHVLKQFEGGIDPLSAVINFWLKGNTSVVISWKSIVKALKSDAINEISLAEKIRKEYCYQDDTKVNEGKNP